MSSPDPTCWTLIHAAAGGDESARSLFVNRYLQPVRAYLSARWKGGPHEQEVDDAAQEVFLDLLKPSGALDRLDPARGSSFRAFLYGMVRNAALHVETRRARELERRAEGSLHSSQIPSDEEALSRVFDRAWAKALLRDAVGLQKAQAERKGPDALRRVEILSLRFQQGLPIRDIAARWGEDPTRMHTEYAQARKEFLRALRQVLGLQEGCPAERLKDECARLIELLGQN